MILKAYVSTSRGVKSSNSLRSGSHLTDLVQLMIEGCYEEAAMRVINRSIWNCVPRDLSITIDGSYDLAPRVAIFGCGPASLACAGDLVKYGYGITLYTHDCPFQMQSNGTAQTDLVQSILQKYEYAAGFICSDQLHDPQSMIRFGHQNVIVESMKNRNFGFESGICKYSNAVTAILAMAVGRKAANLIYQGIQNSQRSDK